MSYTQIWLHVVWGTKYRRDTITKEIKQKLLTHIRENAEIKGIYIDTANCVGNHIHLLITLNPKQTVQEVVKLIKGESSFWINRNFTLERNFKWQEDYYAKSVSDYHVNKVRLYIKRQEEHHSGKE